QPVLPQHQIRIARGPVDVRNEGIEPYDGGSKIGIDIRRCHGIVVEGPREIAQPDVDAEARLQYILNLGIALGAPEAFIDGDESDLRHREPESMREAADDDLRDERASPLPGATELRDEEPSPLRFED